MGGFASLAVCHVMELFPKDKKKYPLMSALLRRKA
jgi:hypothetical protein